MYKFILTLVSTIFLIAGCSSQKAQWSKLSHSPPPDTRDFFIAQKLEQGSDFKPAAVRLVDYHSKTGNYLFRGNIPLKNGTFTYDELMTTLNEIAKKKLHRTIPKDALLIDVSLINSIVEDADLKKEELFFNNNPDKGQLIKHPIYGALTSPNWYPEELRKEFVQIPSIGHLRNLIDQLKALIDNTSNSRRLD